MVDSGARDGAAGLDGAVGATESGTLDARSEGASGDVETTSETPAADAGPGSGDEQPGNAEGSAPAETDGSPADGSQTALPGTDASDEPDMDAADTGPWTVDASCPVTVAAPPLLPGIHVTVGSSIAWDSNPPSSGSHYPIWAAYQSYTTPVPRGYYVHDLEHGAVVFLYNCDDGGCPEVVSALQAASDAIPDDPLCTALGEGIRVLTIITPDPLIDVPVAAVAWGWVYKAQCGDLPSLRDFALQHYGHGSEPICSNGTPVF
jgi:hypothetical protein